MIEVKIDLKEFERGMGAWKSDLRYVASRAINDTLVDAQGAIVDHINDTFTVRRPGFIKRSIKIEKFSNKTDLQGIVGVADIAGQPTANILGKFEEGGIKTPRSGGSIAIPSKFIRPNEKRIVPADKRPRNLMGAVKLHTKRGADILVSVIGKGKRAVRNIAYFLVKHARIPRKLSFREIAVKQIQHSFQLRFNQRFEQVRRKGKF